MPWEQGLSSPTHSFKANCSELICKCAAKRGDASLIPQSRLSAALSIRREAPTCSDYPKLPSLFQLQTPGPRGAPSLCPQIDCARWGQRFNDPIPSPEEGTKAEGSEIHFRGIATKQLRRSRGKFPGLWSCLIVFHSLAARGLARGQGWVRV